MSVPSDCPEFVLGSDTLFRDVMRVFGEMQRRTTYVESSRRGKFGFNIEGFKPSPNDDDTYLVVGVRTDTQTVTSLALEAGGTLRVADGHIYYANGPDKHYVIGF